MLTTLNCQHKISRTFANIKLSSKRSGTYLNCGLSAPLVCNCGCFVAAAAPRKRELRRFAQKTQRTQGSSLPLNALTLLLSLSPPPATHAPHPQEIFVLGASCDSACASLPFAQKTKSGHMRAKSGHMCASPRTSRAVSPVLPLQRVSRFCYCCCCSKRTIMLLKNTERK